MTVEQHIAYLQAFVKEHPEHATSDLHMEGEAHTFAFDGVSIRDEGAVYLRLRPGDGITGVLGDLPVWQPGA